MSETVTPPVDILDEPPEPDDSGPWEFDRGMNTIKAGREERRQLRAETRRWKAATAALLGGRPVPEGIVVSDPAAATGLYESTLRDVGKVLGLSDSDITAPGGPDALIAAAKRSRLAESLSEGIGRANVDPGLARKIIDLSEVDATADAGSIADAIDSALNDAIRAHPAIKKQVFASRSGFEIEPGSGGAPTHVTKEDLAWMTPAQISAARRAGLLEHLNVGKG